MRIPFAVTVASLGLLMGIAYADEPGTAGERGESLKLARANLPLAEQPNFEAELALLADVLAAKIEHPAEPDFVRDRVLGHELKLVFEVVRDWPIDAFRQPLLAYFEKRGQLWFDCAEALLAYRDDDLTNQVDSQGRIRAAIRQRDFAMMSGSAQTMQFVKRALNLKSHDRMEFTVHKKLLPARRDSIFDRLDWPKGMTIPVAVLQLDNSELSIRLQSWVWLAEHGIIASTGVVADAWPQLTREQQDHILDVQPKCLGRVRLLRLFEELEERAPDWGRSAFRVRRAELGDEKVIAESHRVLAEVVKNENSVAELSGDARDALKVVCRFPEPSDIAALVRIHRRGSEWCAAHAWEGLCRIDDPEAIREAGKRLAEPADGFEYSSAIRAIKEQSLKGLKHRDLYIAALVPALHDCLDRDFGNDFLKRSIVRKTVEAFECMSGQDFTALGAANPDKRVRGIAFGIGWNSNKGYSTHGKIMYEDPAAAAAAEALRWYSRKVKTEAERMAARAGR